MDLEQQGEVQFSRHRLEVALATLAARNDEVASLRVRAQAAEAEIAALRQRADVAEASVAPLRLQTDLAEIELAKLRVRAKSSEAERDRIDLQLQIFREALSRAEEAAAELDVSRSWAVAQSDAATVENSRLTLELGAAQARVTLLEKQLADVNSQRLRLEAESEVLAQDWSHQEVALSALAAEASSLRQVVAASSPSALASSSVVAVTPTVLLSDVKNATNSDAGEDHSCAPSSLHDRHASATRELHDMELPEPRESEPVPKNAESVALLSSCPQPFPSVTGNDDGDMHRRRSSALTALQLLAAPDDSYAPVAESVPSPDERMCAAAAEAEFTEMAEAATTSVSATVARTMALPSPTFESRIVSALEPDHDAGVDTLVSRDEATGAPYNVNSAAMASAACPSAADVRRSIHHAIPSQHDMPRRNSAAHSLSTPLQRRGVPRTARAGTGEHGHGSPTLQISPSPLSPGAAAAAIAAGVLGHTPGRHRGITAYVRSVAAQALASSNSSMAHV